MEYMRRLETLKPTGPYCVGTHAIDVKDAYHMRHNHKDDFIPLLIYFPTAKGQHKTYPKYFETRVPKVFPPLTCRVYSQSMPGVDSAPGPHPVILFNHGHNAALTDYACLLEDLASHGYIVIALQSQLDTDPNVPPWHERSMAKYARVLEDNLCVFKWITEQQGTYFQNKIDSTKIACIGHSMGGKALLLHAHKTSGLFNGSGRTLFPYKDTQGVKECIVSLDSSVSPPPVITIPTFLCFSEERYAHQKNAGALDVLSSCGYPYKHYPGSKHISFMDHGWVHDYFENDPMVSTFNGDLTQRQTFFENLRLDIRQFLYNSGVNSKLYPQKNNDKSNL